MQRKTLKGVKNKKRRTPLLVSAQVHHTGWGVSLLNVRLQRCAERGVRLWAASFTPASHI